MERLYELHVEGNYDLIVVDTPPSRNALDFIEAPQRMADFFSSRLLRLLIVPYRRRVINVASRPFYQIADRILGSQFLEDIAEFFILFQTMYDGFVERAKEVERLLHDWRTTFVVVSTLESAPVHEAEFFVGVLARKRFDLGALVLNKMLPAYFLDEGAARRAEWLSSHVDVVAEKAAAATGEDREQVMRVLLEVAESFRNYEVVAQREAKQRSDLAVPVDVVTTVPYFETDIHDLGGLVRLGEALWG
jgi:anion-transporting  ArsA/GET3 family ATPase